MNKLKRIVKRNLLNIPGWRTKRKIVVIESDDWGAIRLPASEILETLKKAGVDIGRDHYIRNDAVASEEDFEMLFDSLCSVEDSRGKPAVLTANTIVANPDFEKIKDSGYRRYFYEPFTETLKRYPKHENSFTYWNEGADKGIFYPQFHGREHVQVGRWLKGLNDRDSETFKAFNHQLYALCSGTTSENRKSYMAAWEWDNDEDRTFNLESIADGLNLFEALFGYRSRSAIAPNYTWNRKVEEVLRDGGVKYLQGSVVQRSPEIGKKDNKPIRHFTGQTNKQSQIYMVRNCRFEPTAEPRKNWIESCINEIQTAFRWGKPAIIESHRVNYIGYINPENRDGNHLLLKDLLKRIIQKWPETEFMTTEQLGRVIENDQ